MALRSWIAAGQSLLLILARTAARSAAPGLEGVSTANRGGVSTVRSRTARNAPTPNLPPKSKRQIGCMGRSFCSRSTRIGSQAALGFRDAFGRREDVAAAVLGEGTQPRVGKMGAANHHLF